MEIAWIYGLLGGLLIGTASALYLLFNGRIAGMTGILTNAFGRPWTPAGRESIAFLAGAAVGPVLMAVLWQPVEIDITRMPVALILGGLVVGVGVALANGCTSGHGVCGMSRLSIRSIAATLTFMAGTAVSVFLVRHVFGGLS